MDKIKSILLPLALVFAAIAIFEFGARYGASNTRAVALTGQLMNFVNLYKQVSPHADEPSKAHLEGVIDNHIMTAALVREAWYLKFREQPRKNLETAMTAAFALRGDAILQRLETLQNTGDEGAKLSPQRYEEIRSALESALEELAQQASTSSSEASE